MHGMLDTSVCWIYDGQGISTPHLMRVDLDPHMNRCSVNMTQKKCNIAARTYTTVLQMYLRSYAWLDGMSIVPWLILTALVIPSIAIRS